LNPDLKIRAEKSGKELAYLDENGRFITDNLNYITMICVASKNISFKSIGFM